MFGAEELTARGQPPLVLTSSTLIGSKASAELFDRSYDEFRADCAPLWRTTSYRRIVMKQQPLRTSVIGSYPFPAWLEYAAEHLEDFGRDDIAEMQRDAVITAVYDQTNAGLDVISDGEQTRLDFNLSFYGYINGIAREDAEARRYGACPRSTGKHAIVWPIVAPRGLGWSKNTSGWSN
jgi:hypothetical protein